MHGDSAFGSGQNRIRAGRLEARIRKAFGPPQPRDNGVLEWTFETGAVRLQPGALHLWENGRRRSWEWTPADWSKAWKAGAAVQNAAGRLKDSRELRAVRELLHILRTEVPGLEGLKGSRNSRNQRMWLELRPDEAVALVMAIRAGRAALERERERG